MNKERKWQLDAIKIESGNNINKISIIPLIKKRVTLASRNAYELNKTNIRKCPIPWTCESRVVRSDLMSVCVCV